MEEAVHKLSILYEHQVQCSMSPFNSLIIYVMYLLKLSVIIIVKIIYQHVQSMKSMD